MKKITVSLISLMLMINLSACGTILYPERSGQQKGHLDIGIVALDALGLLFFFVPGVIAFAIDFSNGTIYLPGGYLSTLSDEEIKAVTVDGGVDMQVLAKLINEKAWVDGCIQAKHIQVAKVQSSVALTELFQRHVVMPIAAL